MGHKVKLLPVGREFIVENNETLLDAAIRAGIALPYACGSGNCGLCKAKIVEGELRQIRHQDFAFSAAEQAQHFALMCTNTIVSDLVLEAQAATSAEDIEVQNFRAKVRKIERISDELLILHLRPPRSNRLRFLAGQYATLGLTSVGEFDYSIASCPCDDKRLEFHIRYDEDAPVSRYIFHSLRIGAWVDVTAPKGHFVLREGSRRPMIMIAFDTGFAAIKSLLEHATAQEDDRNIHLYWIVCGKEGPYLHNLCRSWQDALDELQYTPLTISGSYQSLLNHPNQNLEISEQQLLQVVQDHPDLGDFDVYIAAPELFLESARNIFIKAGLDPSHLSNEIVRGNQKISCLMLEELAVVSK